MLPRKDFSYIGIFRVMKNTTKRKKTPHATTTTNSFTLINFKVKDKERKLLMANARRFSHGNVSAFLRRVACRVYQAKGSSKAA